ncbi:FAD-binding oxidoreductase [Streptomyces sp. HD]|uniref:FAD-binding oxidoreductase n=1 Tax=Streptomyces sp. HD TaxID=3020892 RepID=UPI00232C8C03|nr:FAD-binding oxidoreductase [Streptomyces sp. HD]MDC0771397.1 FAD-binding oxidoreductase [Streptomyces sp. HD]
MKDDVLDRLRGLLLGEVLGPQDAGYDTARRVYNAMIDKRPAVIARCLGTADVVNAVRFAREEGLPIAVRGGGHSVAGHGTCDDGIVIDLSPMRGVHVDPVNRTVRVQGGALLGDVDRETQLHGLAIPTGQMSETGIAGLTLNGGVGMMLHKYGLTCDNLLSADMVTVDGELVTASADRRPELFWALRGGGGNFGVVTSFEFRAHPVGPMMLAGFLAHPVEEAPQVLEFLRDFSATSPAHLSADALFIHAPEAGFVPAEFWGMPLVTLFVRYFGPMEDAWEAVQPLRDFGNPLYDSVGPMPLVAVQSMLDTFTPAGNLHYWTSEFVPSLGSEQIAALAAMGSDLPSSLTTINVHPFDTAATEVPPDATAFAHREDSWLIHVICQWKDEADSDRCRAWVKQTGRLLKRFGCGNTYLNTTSEDDETDRVRAFWNEHRLARLAEVKAEYDPDNVLRFNHNIPPAARESGS